MPVSEWQLGSEDQAQWDKFYDIDGQTMLFNIRRERIEPGRSFSAEALEGIMEGVKFWIGTRLMKMWDESGDPPVSLDITVTVENAVKATDEAHRRVNP